MVMSRGTSEWVRRLEEKLDDPEPGTFGGAVVHSYTWLFGVVFAWHVVDLARQDLGTGGRRYLCAAFGLESVGWTWFWLIALLWLSFGSTGAAARLYWEYTGRTFVADRIGFAKSGAVDVASWLQMLSTLGSISIFAFV